MEANRKPLFVDQKQLEKLCKLAKKYGIKSVDLCDNAVKIEFTETSNINVGKKLTKKQLEFLADERERLVKDEMQMVDTEAYEDEIARMDGGLKEIR